MVHARKGINPTSKSHLSLNNIAKTIPPRSDSRIRSTLMNLLSRTIASRIRRRMAIRVTVLSASHRLSDTKALLRASKRVISRSLWEFGYTTAIPFVGAGIGELLREWRALAEDGAFPVDDVDGDNEDEGDAEEDCGGVCEMVFAFAANVGEEWSGGKCENTCEEITRPSISASC